MRFKHFLALLLLALTCFPLMAQVDDDKQYKGVKLDNTSGVGEIITVAVLPLGNGILYFRNASNKTPLDGNYRLIVHDNMYYIGNISKGLVDGDWEQYRYDRLYEKGMYKKGRAHGKYLERHGYGYEGEYTFEEGVPKHYIAHYKNKQLRQERFYDDKGKLHGTLRTYNEEGTLIHEGHYENGELQGTEMRVDKKGYKVLCDYKDGRKVGAYSKLYPNGEVLEKGAYSEGEKKEGLWIYGKENGDRKMEENYSEGKLHGVKQEFYEGNVLKLREEYANGKLHGETVYYDETPHTKNNEGTFMAGNRHGVFKVYHNGILWRETIYQDNKLVGKKEYADGKLQIIQLIDETGAMVDVGKYDNTGKQVYRNQNYRKHNTLKLKEDAYGVIDVEF